MKGKILVIVAHPDDETIWMGGTLLKNHDKWEITILSLCRKYDEDRAPKFNKVCNMLKARCFMSDLEDEKLNEISINEVMRRIKKLPFKKYDRIFTHGKNGEYGHIRHKDVNKAVIHMIERKMLLCKEIYFFSYSKKGKFSYPKKNSDRFINLNKSFLEKKKKLIRDVYGFDKNSFEDVCCRGAEAFNIGRLK